MADNFDAFELLLDAGADPDQRLFGTIVPQRTYMSFTRHDTVLFASLKASRSDFFLAALKHTDNVNQRDISQDTFLHLCIRRGGSLSFSTSIGGDVSQALIDAGIDLDARDRYGCTAAYYAADRSDGVALCWQLLQAGADPEIPSDQGSKLADRLSHRMKWFKQQGLTQHLAEAERVKAWLESNRKSKAAPE